MNQFKDQLPVGLLAALVYRRGQGSNSGKPEFFFRLFFLNCISCAFNCDDLLCIYHIFLLVHAYDIISEGYI